MQQTTHYSVIHFQKDRLKIKQKIQKYTGNKADSHGNIALQTA